MLALCFDLFAGLFQVVDRRCHSLVKDTNRWQALLNLTFDVACCTAVVLVDVASVLVKLTCVAYSSVTVETVMGELLAWVSLALGEATAEGSGALALDDGQVFGRVAVLTTNGQVLERDELVPGELHLAIWCRVPRDTARAQVLGALRAESPSLDALPRVLPEARATGQLARLQLLGEPPQTELVVDVECVGKALRVFLSQGDILGALGAADDAGAARHAQLVDAVATVDVEAGEDLGVAIATVAEVARNVAGSGKRSGHRTCAPCIYTHTTSCVGAVNGCRCGGFNFGAQ